ncbi:MAG: hypothetical protein ABFS86_18005, partial [Planctomycetota bacterium]
MEGGAFQSKKMAKATHEYVFVWQHQTEPDSCESYKLVTEEFLEETFLHPAYIYLRPDGTEIDKELRDHHMSIPGQKMLQILDRAQKEWGRGLTEAEYAKHRETMKEAEELFVARKGEEAKKLLKGLGKLRQRCGLKERAKAMLAEMAVREKLLAEWNAREDTRPALKASIERSLRIGEIVPAWRTLRKASDDVAEEFEKKVLEALSELIRLKPIRLDRVFADQRSYYYLRAEWETDLMPFTGLVLTLAYMTDRDRTLGGYAKFDQLRPYRHHRAATSLDSRMLKLQDVTNARVQLWLDDVLLA